MKKDGKLTGTDTVDVSGLFTWNGGTLADSGQINANGGLVLHRTDGAQLTLQAGTLNNAGAATFLNNDPYWGGPALMVNSGAVINNLSGATWDFQCDASIVQYYYGVAATFNNAGTLQKSAGLLA
jgi:hypothetical protein